MSSLRGQPGDPFLGLCMNFEAQFSKNLTDWTPYLAHEFHEPYMRELQSFLCAEYKNKTEIYPQKEKIFRALQFVPYNEVKVVILGQDPYHGLNQANGLAFAVEKGVSAPPSLKNIFKEIAQDLKTEKTPQFNLENWAKQGVLLLNTVLTVRKNEPFSHRKKGWEIFTDKILLSLNKKKTPVVFILWGSPAQLKSSLITSSLHKILIAPHPSPLSAYRGFLGCGHFSKTNEFLKRNNLDPIYWDE